MKKYKHVTLLVVLALLSATAMAGESAAPEAPNLFIDWLSINNGGTIEVATTSFRVGISVGQTAAGEVSSPSYSINLGFWQPWGSGSCCVGRVGDVNYSGIDEPTIGDVAELVDHLFIDKPALVCVEEADINQSGGLHPSPEMPGSDITIGDLADLVDYLFITGPEHGVLLDCL